MPPERQKEVTEKDSQTIGQYLLNGELQKVKEKLRELEIETLATIPLPSGHSGNWLHIAVSARQNAEAIMNFALSSNSLDVNQQSDSGYTPLHLAAHEGNLSVCGILLLNESASPSIVNKDGLIPLHLFVLHSYTWFG
jgi:hypothetical protein